MTDDEKYTLLQQFTAFPPEWKAPRLLLALLLPDGNELPPLNITITHA